MTRKDFSRLLSVDEADQLLGEKVDEADPNIVDETFGHDADTGEFLFAYVPVGPVSDLRKAVLSLDMSNTRRATGINNVSRTFGYRARKPVNARDGCGRTRTAGKWPEAHAALEAWAVKLADMFKGFNADQVARDAAVLDAVGADWKMGELWTSGVVNRSSRLPYHRDKNNFPTWSAMPVVRRGMAGGYLSIPEYGLTVACRDGWALYFAGHRYVHGVTPMWKTQPDGYRYSIVYYALRGMKDCHTAALEAAYGRRRRTEREREMARLISLGQRPDLPIVLDKTYAALRREAAAELAAADDPDAVDNVDVESTP